MATVEGLIPVRQYAQVQGVTAEYVRILCRSGRLPALKVGHAWLILPQVSPPVNKEKANDE